MRLTRDWAHRAKLSALFFAFGLFTSLGHAAELEPPTGEVILIVTGAISSTNDGSAAKFDRAMLASLPQIKIRSVTPWTEGEIEFEGPYARDVMSKVGATGTKAVATAHDNYQAEIPLSDFEEIPVIMAIARDGKPMRLSDKGPVWIVYPWSEQPELITETYRSRSVWQLRALHVK